MRGTAVGSSASCSCPTGGIAELSINAALWALQPCSPRQACPFARDRQCPQSAEWCPPVCAVAVDREGVAV